MKKALSNWPFGMFIRYLAVILLGIGNLWIIYLLFTPLTISAVSFILSLFGGLSVSGSTILLPSISIEIVKSCVAGAAYYLLIILNLATPMHFKTRAKSLIFSILLFFILNIFRIIIFTKFYAYGFSFADEIHKLSWYFVSTILLILIWFTTAKLFKINEIPFYSDAKKLKKLFS